MTPEHPSRRGRAQPGFALAMCGALLALACASAPKTERLSPQTMSSTPPPPAENLPGPDPREVPAASSDAESGEADSNTAPARDSLTVVIEDETNGQGKQMTLVEAAAAERKRRAAAGESIAVVTDKNLASFRDGQLTEVGLEDAGESATAAGADPGPPGPGASAVAPPASSPTPDAEGITIARSDPEAYWRGRILRARMNWASAVEEALHLEGKIAELRQRFYAEEDPYYRDSQIKPSWDRALDRLEEARAAITKYRKEVQTILDEGRRASALPGWLREGIDLEPDADEGQPRQGPKPPGEYLPGEPQVAADPDGASR